MNQRVLDYEEFTSGFQSARDAAIADSRFRHEQVEFDRLCVQLAKRAWSACLGSQDPEEARLARARWRDAHRELACSQQPGTAAVQYGGGTRSYLRMRMRRMRSALGVEATREVLLATVCSRQAPD